MALLGAALAGGCSTDIFDVEVDLSTEVYNLDFGPPRGSIPVIECDPAAAGPCDGSQIVTVDVTSQGIPATVDLQAGCDAGSHRCFAEATTRVAYTVDVLSDDQFTTKVARGSISLVRVADVVYAVPINTLTFTVPQVNFYVGPAGSTRETDPGVVLVGSTPPLAPGTTTSDQHLTVTDDSPARAVIEGNIRQRLPFTFVVAVTPHLAAGDPVPAGTLEVDVAPRLLIGLPR